ncbi:MAG: hypothetical protein ABIZ80_16965, partial [Bryobacteraceae bacterium]
GLGERAGGVWKSTDGGAVWTKLESLPGNGGVYGLAADPQNAGILYASNGSGLFKSTDRGTNWVNVYRTGRALRLTMDPKSPNTLYIVLNGTFAGELPGVYKTTDGGKSWNPVNSGLPISLLDYIDTLVMDPQRTGTLYAAVRGKGVYRTTDGGANWSVVNFGLGTLDVYTLAIDPQDTSTLYAGTSSGVFSITFAAQ